jgi:hypothetical protein
MNRELASQKTSAFPNFNAHHFRVRVGHLDDGFSRFYGVFGE